MALKKLIEINNSGVEADYIVLESFAYNKEAAKVEIQLAIYKDQATRDAGKEPINRVVLELDNEGTVKDGIASTLYKEIKKVDLFNGALDV